jgi:hypothetical protein
VATRALVVDDGLFVHVASSLAAGFDSLSYFCRWRDHFPSSSRYMIGRGLRGVERVAELWAAVAEANLVIVPDVQWGDFVDECRRRRIATWGATYESSRFELDRWYAREIIRAAGLPLTKAKRLFGLDGVSEFLQTHDDLYVKTSFFRADFETYHHVDWFLTKQWLDDVAEKVGSYQFDYEFIIEEPIEDAVEVAMDAFVVDGRFPETVAYGYELKDAGYVGRAVPMTELPAPLRRVNDALAPYLRDSGHRGFISLECRVTRSGEPYLIDPCMRAGSPPSELLSEWIANWPEVIERGASGGVVDPRFHGRFGVQLQLKSAFAERHHLPLSIDRAVSRHVHLHNHWRMPTDEGTIDYVVPIGIPEIGAVAAAAATVAEAAELCLERASKVHAYELEYNDSAFTALDEVIAKGRECGIDWPKE